jgi:ParB family chromosome partitioning protein
MTCRDSWNTTEAAGYPRPFACAKPLFPVVFPLVVPREKNMSLLESLGPALEARITEPVHLKLLAKVKKALATGQDVTVPFTDIRRNPNQPRKYFSPESIKRLSLSIDQGGQIMQGLIRSKPDTTPYELIDGERRWHAIAWIPEERRPLYRARLIAADDDVVQFLISGIANFNREGHTPMETAETIDQMLRFKIPMQEVAALLGLSKFWAEQMHGLKKLSSKVQEMLDPELPKDKRLPLTAAIEISKIEPKLQAELAQRVLSKDVTISRLRGEVVRTAQENNSPIRLREVSVRNKWASVVRKLDEAERLTGDADAILQSRTVDLYIRKGGGTVEFAEKQIAEMENTLTRMKIVFGRAKN